VKYIIELEPGVWAAKWPGDPGRTLVPESAKRFNSESAAKKHLANIRRKFTPFLYAEIKQVTI
jgi:hypothetical protein